ncbi:hypothetical protein QBC38DRAFT_526180 [Podospora fimiseda]|uniref:Uncharacterized protein n=1 Tax=Podospora fimiseda TaxID=252190 RepID=A0AAN7BR00_9PEZI|nr:hypothetical protein QBC38DRAFT_526180 [Podospora fimiseda]
MVDLSPVNTLAQGARNPSRFQQFLHRHKTRATVINAILEKLFKPEHMHYQNTKEGKEFICKSDLRNIWNTHREHFDRLFQRNRLKDKQVETLVSDENHLLELLSYLVWIKAPDSCFLTFRDNVFKKKTAPELSDKFEGLPLSVDALTNFGIDRTTATMHRNTQYRFIPVTIDIKKAQNIQSVGNECERLPFIEGDKKATKPRLVAVKTLRDNKDEIKNLKILKESLTKNDHISFHDAIIKHGPSYKIISGQAELGDLDQFLLGDYHRDQAPKVNRETYYDFGEKFPNASGKELTTALLDQCYKLATALKFLHLDIRIPEHVACAHMDLSRAIF